MKSQKSDTTKSACKAFRNRARHASRPEDDMQPPRAELTIIEQLTTSVDPGDPRTNFAILVKLEKALIDGNRLKNACTLAGLRYGDVERWMARGTTAREGTFDRLFYDFVETARAKAEARNVSHIQTAAATDWKAAAWFLEHSNPEAYGKPALLSSTFAILPSEAHVMPGSLTDEEKKAAFNGILKSHPDLIPAEFRRPFSN